MSKTLFCNKCHKRIVPPTFLKQMEGQIKGKMKINCGDTKCKGHATIKGNEKNTNDTADSDSTKLISAGKKI